MRRVLLAAGAILLLTLGCREAGRSPSTPAGVARFTTIDLAHVARYAPALPAHFDRRARALDNAPAPTPADDRLATLGRVLFYDLRLSTNDKASCAACHQQAHGFTDPMRFSNGISNAATTDFHAMRLANIRYWQPGTTFWDRRGRSVEAQVSDPLHSLVEMGWGGPAGGMDALIRKLAATAYYPDLFAWAFGDPAITEPRIQRATAQFVRAIVAADSRWDQGYARVFAPGAADGGLGRDLPTFSAVENRGRRLFMTPVARGGAGCSGCHVPPTFALAPDAMSNGLDAGERRLFKAPSLRNVAVTGPYMHDGRFETLAAVIDFYATGVQPGPALDPRLRDGAAPRRLPLTPVDRAALVAFLGTLTDRRLLTDPRFADPFRRPPSPR